MSIPAIRTLSSRCRAFAAASVCALFPTVVLIFGSAVSTPANTVVFWQEGFPAIASQRVPHDILSKALNDTNLKFAGIEGFRDPATLARADLVVFPYGSAVPVDVWSTIHAYLRGGGNLLILGGQPLRVPVRFSDGKFIEGHPQDSYARELDFRHTYELPQLGTAKFAWKFGYSFLPAPEVRARRFFAVEGRLDGLGYMVNSEGIRVAAPVIVVNHTNISMPSGAMLGSRFVVLDFEPEPGYWESADGTALIREAADYARQGSISFWLETLFSLVKPGEPPQIVVHLRNAYRQRHALPLSGDIRIELRSGDQVLDGRTIQCSGEEVTTALQFPNSLEPGLYTVRGLYSDAGRPREFYQNGFWVEDQKMLMSGPVLGVRGDFLTRDGKPFFPVGTNYFTTEENGWDFSGPRNAWVWENDFAEMAKYGVTFVRTGVWMPNLRFVEPLTDKPNERFLRNLEAYLMGARRHNIIVNFTFFAFVPRTSRAGFDALATTPAANPYTDPVSVRIEQEYALAVVRRFKDPPWLCWDLINEPSFSNPKRVFKGNIPNGDPTETAAWHKWLKKRYATLADLAVAWAVTPEQLVSVDAIPLPSDADLTLDRYGNRQHVRAVDYNLFAQDIFAEWIRGMVGAIRATGSRQLIDVGQDEGGVTNRVLNRFYAGAGLSFTTNHTYWRDDALLWDSVAAKHPGIPNIVGETGYQPVWGPDGLWRYDEVTGYPLLERKWALGFAAGNSGVLQWDWAREVNFGMHRSDNSAKLWQPMMRGMAQFAQKAEPWATGIVQPQVAIVLPQSLQLSIFNGLAIEAQQKCVRALYHYARSEAYGIGEYQIDLLGNPKLIIVPSPFVLTTEAWDSILARVQAGSTLLISGPFDDDVHFHPSGRQNNVGIHYTHDLLAHRENILKWPEGQARLTYGGDKTTFLNRAVPLEGSDWIERPVGKGRLLFAALPLELNDNLEAIGSTYRYALKMAGVASTYSTTVDDPGILICPTRFPHATLYVLTSESDQRRDISFRDGKSGKQFSGSLDPGRAALLMVSDEGSVISSYNWANR